MNIENIPEELRQLNQWLCWKQETDKNGKSTKIPYVAKEGFHKKASSTKTDDWRNDRLAAEICQKQKFDGIGFVFTKDDPYCGIDLDHSVDENGNIETWAADILNRFGSYSEKSPSGRGIHIIVKAKLAGPGTNNELPGYPGAKVEIYDRGRYFTMTGNVLEGYNTIQERQNETESLYRILNPESEKKPPEKTYPKHHMTNDQILTVIQKSKQAEKFKQLWSGDLASYPSQSEADLALCCVLAFYTQDYAQILSIIRDSKLWDDKWEREDYQQRTIGKALKGMTKVYQWRQKPETPDDYMEGSETKLTAKPINCQSLLDMDLPEPPMTIGKGLLPRDGYTLLGGPTKTGKTTLIGQMFLHILAGVDFLGFPVERKVNILYCFLENTYNSISKLLKQQIKHFQYDMDLGRLNFLECRGLSLQSKSGIEFLTKNTVDTKSELVVIDPVSLAMDRDMNDIATIRTFVRILQKISDETKAGWLLIHHYGKPNIVKRDPIAKVLGSSGFGIYCESFIGIERYSERRSPEYKRLSFKFRHGAEREDLCLYLNPATRLFELVDDPENISAVSIDRVIEILKNHGEPISHTLFKELIRVNLSVGDRTARTLIQGAKESGKILKEDGKYGRYFV